MGRMKLILQILAIAVLVAGSVIPFLTNTVAAVSQDEPCDGCQQSQTEGEFQYPAMRPSLETLQRWVEAYNNAPIAPVYELESLQIPSPQQSLSLLDHLQYTPSERDQGYCGNCWVWAGTGVMEIALDVQNGIKDRLSIQYLNSNYGVGGYPDWACCGGWLAYLAAFYTGTGQAIPWSNTNASWQDGGQDCYGSTTVPPGSISTTPNYPITSITAQTIPTQGVGEATAIANIKNILDQDKAVWFGFFVATSADWNNFTNFWGTQVEDTIWDPDFSCGHTAVGGPIGHAVLCVGYNDEEGTENDYWIMLNSWGTTASRPNGLFRLDMHMDYDCYFYNPEPFWDYSFYFQTLAISYSLPAPTEVWVDDDFDDSTPGWGYDHFASIQDGIDAVAGSTVHVAAGYYTENITLVNGVEVLGAGADVTTIDGGGSDSVVIANNVDSTTKLDGFTITNGNAYDGGGIALYSSSPAISNCVFSGNNVTNFGGAIYCGPNSSSPTISNCTFNGNSSAYCGGAIMCGYPITILNCAFDENSATYGGAYYEMGSGLSTIANCTFSGNSTEWDGGAMYLSSVSPIIINCSFSENSAVNRYGGAIYFHHSSLTVTNCIISNNSADDAGGGIFADTDSSPTIDYNDVWNNSPDNYYNCSPGANDISQDPMFVDPGIDDYHLQLSSSCVDVGDNSAPSIPSTDFEGDPRIMDGDGDLVAVVDIGADERETLANNPPNAPDSPLCEGVPNPTGVTDPTPEFSWTFSDPDGGDNQGAYQILVASSSANLTADNGDMWDSGKVSGSDNEVSYDGLALGWYQTYYWKVKTWDNHDVESTYCGEQQFTTGTLAHGLFRVETSPPVPTTISANGIPRNAWGLDWVKMPPGEYFLSFTDTPGHLVPETIEVTYYPGGGPTTQPLGDPIMILSDTTTEVIVNFVQLGNLWVRTDPMVPTIISLDGAPPSNNWGFWVDLLPGDYNLSISDVVGYKTPVEVEVTYPGEAPVIQAITDPITVEPGGTTAVVIHFIQLGNLHVTTDPMLPATIFVDGHPMNEWGFWLDLEEGEYTVSFENMPGYITPSPEVVIITAGVTTEVTGYYVSE